MAKSQFGPSRFNWNLFEPELQPSSENLLLDEFVGIDWKWPSKFLPFGINTEDSKVRVQNKANVIKSRREL